MLDNVTINQLRAFVAVCDQGSFSGAARELNRAQSAISHAINALEPAVIANLAPGAYTAIVSGAGGTTGVGLVGVFKTP